MTINRSKLISYFVYIFQTPKRISSAGLQRCSFEISSPGSESISQQQAFFGDSFEPGFDDSRGTDLASISEAEV